MPLNDLPARIDNARDDVDEAIRAYMTDMDHERMMYLGWYVLGMKDYRVVLYKRLLDLEDSNLGD